VIFVFSYRSAPAGLMLLGIMFRRLPPAVIHIRPLSGGSDSRLNDTLLSERISYQKNFLFLPPPTEQEEKIINGIVFN
jgi:hypothetical protein